MLPDLTSWHVRSSVSSADGAACCAIARGSSVRASCLPRVRTGVHRLMSSVLASPRVGAGNGGRRHGKESGREQDDGS
jgi:hypothetical protein